MTTTTVPASVVTIARVKIDKNRKGWYVLRSMELGAMAVARSRDILWKIAANKNWTIVKAWA